MTFHTTLYNRKNGSRGSRTQVSQHHRPMLNPLQAGQLILAPFRVMKSNLLRVSGGALAKHRLLDHQASGQPDRPDRGDLGVAHLLEELNVIPGNSYRQL